MSFNKKLFTFSIGGLVLVLFFWGIYFWAFSPKNDSSGTASSKTGSALINLIAQKSEPQISIIYDTPIIDPSFDDKNQLIRFYDKNTGKSLSIDFDGNNLKTLSGTELIGLSDVFWSPDHLKVISQFNHSDTPSDFFFYDYSNNQSTKLKSNLDSVFWYNNDRIVYKYFDSKTSERTLNVSNPDGSNWKKITDLSYKNLLLSPIPKSGLVAFWNAPRSGEETKIQSISLLGGDPKVIFQGKFGADYLWSPSGNRILISHLDQKNGSKMQLAITNSQGGEYVNLDIPTFRSKCVWSNDENSLFYALPTNIPTNAVLPDDYQNKKFTTTDTFWKVDIKTGKKERLITPDKISQSIDADQLFLTSDEKYLFFVNRVDNKIYRLSL